MVKIIANNANYDISGALTNDICELLCGSSCEKKIIIIVPEQFEFETEKLIYKKLSERDLLTRYREMKIETFSSLSKKILADIGEKRPPANDTIKNILMHKAVREQKDTLTSLARQANKNGFCKKMVNTVSVLKSAGLSAADFDEKAIKKRIEENENLKNHLPVINKLCDVGKIQTGYESYLSRYIDSLNAVGEAADAVTEKSGYFRNAEVFVDGFNDFTGNQLYFLKKITGKAKNITFGFTVELDENSRENLFFNLRNQIEKIKISAYENGEETVTVTRDIPEKKSGNSSLKQLSDKIFGSSRSDSPLDGSCVIVKASDIFEEADYVCAEIKRLCVDKEFLYREIAVLCADPKCSKHIKSAFEKYEIPAFFDIPETILYHPAVNLFLSLINVLRDFSAENVLSLIKTGFLSKPADENSGNKSGKTALSKKDIDTFESYIYEWNLKAKHLKKPFDFADRDSSAAVCAEEIRKAVADPLLKLQKELKNCDGAEITRKIYEFAADEIGIERALYSRCLKQESGEIDTELLRVNQMVWDSLAEILETLERELTGDNISLDEYFRLFYDICSGTVLAKPPQFQDCVLVGDIDRTRAVGIKAAFIVGAAYDYFPTSNEGTGIFSENETEFIRENLDGLGFTETTGSLKTRKEQYCLSVYRAYKAISLPNDFLSISYSENDEKGSTVQRSQIINDILNIFPQTEIISASGFSDSFFCRSVKSAKQRYTKILKENSRRKALLKKTLIELGCKDFTDKLDEISKIKSKNRPAETIGSHKLSRETAQNIFDRKLGATSAEKLNLCKFRYFCEFGLKIKEKNQRIFNVGNRGNAIHFVLQKILGKYCGNILAFFKLNRNDFTALAAYYLQEFCLCETNGDFEDDKRTKFLFANLANVAADVLIILQAEFASRDYRPKFFELNLSDETQKFIVSNDEKPESALPEAALFSDISDVKIDEVSDDFLFPNKDYILTKPLEITLDDNSKVIISGRIDRIDMFFTSDENGEKRSYLRVVDYKFNAKSFDVSNAKNGINIQMLLYLFALCDANQSNKTAVLPGGICYVPSASSGAVDSKTSAFRLLALNHHQNGLYVKDEFTDEEAKKYADFLIEKLALNNEKAEKSILKAFIPEGKNAPTPEEFDALRSDCLALLKDNLESIFNGEIDAVPVKYSESNIGIDGKSKKTHKISCDYCRFSAICNNRMERVTDIENNDKGVNSGEQ